MTMTSRTHLDRMFDADRELRDAESALLATGDEETLTALFTAAISEAKALKDRREAIMRLERLADLCAQIPGPIMVDALISILDDDAPSVRTAAGEALLDVGYDRYAEVARAIERRLDRKDTGLAMRELPWLLSEIGEPSALGLLKRFLENADGEVAASAVEALASLSDPAAVPALEALKKDKRLVSIDDGEQETRVTLGELATEAANELRKLDDA